MALLSLKDVSVSYGGQPLLDGVEFHVERGDRICLLGVNGTGKSTMLRVLAGESNPDEGEVIRARSVRVARLPQQVPVHLQGRIFDIVCPDPGNERHNLEARQILSRLELDPAAEFAALSGGTRRRVLLAQVLLGSPDVVLLDEPTNHLDLDSIAWLETFLLRHCRTFLFVTHDRAFLRRLATRIVELDRGKLSDWACDYDTFLRRKEEVLHAEARQWEAQDRRLLKEEAWRRQGVKARTVRNQGRLRALISLREERRQRRERPGSVKMNIQQGDRTGHVVIKAEGVSFAYPEPSSGRVSAPNSGAGLIREFSTVIVRGDKIGILGPNGCGKTTLLRLLLEPAGSEGCLAPQSGCVTHGTNLQIAYADQLRGQLDDKRSLAENIAGGQEFVMIGGTRRHIIGYLEDFLFTPERARQPVGALSGGERNRLLLARLFAQPSNVLVLDEPTNDLDLDTLELLEEQLATYAGTVLLVSHDRTFLNDVVTSVLAFEKHSAAKPDEWLGPREGWYVNEYVGGYDDWVAQRTLPPAPGPGGDPAADSAPRAAPARAGEAAPKGKRLSYKEKRELESLPGRIEALEAEQAQWHARLADPAFYRSVGDEIANARRRAEELAAELSAVYSRWEELETAAQAQAGPRPVEEVPNTAVIPAPKIEEDFYDWYARHGEKCRQAAERGHDLIFIGDSITHLFEGDAKLPNRGERVWGERYGSRNALNLGFGWDRTQNVLWRLAHGEFAGQTPRLLVLLIGTNNLTGTGNAPTNSPAEIAQGIQAICGQVAAASPGTRVLLMGVFPRGAAGDPLRAQVRELNAILKRWADRRQGMEFMDIGARFLAQDGTIPAEIMDDGVHLTDRGYRIWAEAIEPAVRRALA